MLNCSSEDSSRPAESPLEAFHTVNCDKKVEHGHTAQHPSQYIDGLQSDTSCQFSSMQVWIHLLWSEHTKASRFHGIDCAYRFQVTAPRFVSESERRNVRGREGTHSVHAQIESCEGDEGYPAGRDNVQHPPRVRGYETALQAEIDGVVV